MTSQNPCARDMGWLYQQPFYGSETALTRLAIGKLETSTRPAWAWTRFQTCIPRPAVLFTNEQPSKADRPLLPRSTFNERSPDVLVEVNPATDRTLVLIHHPVDTAQRLT